MSKDVIISWPEGVGQFENVVQTIFISTIIFVIRKN